MNLLSGSDWGPKKKPLPRRFLTFMAVLVALLAIFPLYTRFKSVAQPVPPGVYLGGMDLSDISDTTEIRHHLEAEYGTPIAVSFGSRRLALRPGDVDFTLEVEQMLAEAQTYLSGPPLMDMAVRYAFGFEQARRDVPARFTLDSAKLRAWLEGVAAEYNTAPQPARAVAPAEGWANAEGQQTGMPAGFVGAYVNDWVWQEGAPGYSLDIEKSMEAVVAALANNQRTANLVLVETPAPVPSMEDLARVLNTNTLDFPGFAAVYVQDLTHGDGAGVDFDVAFSGMSTMKIGIAAAVMAKLENGIQANDPVSYEVGQWLDYALGESNNHAANLLLRWLGNGDTTAGTRVFTEFVRSIGMESTYMQSGYDVSTQLPQIATPGNQQAEWDTHPDSNLQTTPREMGQILAAIYECTLDKGILRERYAEQITPDECSQILFYMTHDQFRELIWGGLPELNNQWILHKHGFAFESHSDVALVWGPNGPYVMSVFLFRNGWMDWSTSNSTMQMLSRITWNFFEFQREIEAREAESGEVPIAPTLAPPPGYVQIQGFVPAPDAAGE